MIRAQSSQRILPLHNHPERADLAKNANTFEKLRRESEKKRKADDKRKNKLVKREQPPAALQPPPDRFAEGY